MSYTCDVCDAGQVLAADRHPVVVVVQDPRDSRRLLHLCAVCAVEGSDDDWQGYTLVDGTPPPLGALRRVLALEGLDLPPSILS